MTIAARDTMRDMQETVFVYDPTLRDTKSKVRGIGRYLQILQDSFRGEFTFSDDIASIRQGNTTVFFNPFFNIIQKPLTLHRLARKQVTVIHDLIPLKYPSHFPVGLWGNINRLLNMWSLSNYDIIITDSLASKNDISLLLQIPHERIKVVYPCISKNMQTNLEDHSRHPSYKDYFLYVGDATWNKNLVNMAKAIKKADVSCVFAGKVFTETGSLANAWQRELAEFFELTRGDGRFKFPGYVTDRELASLYQGANANLLLSRDEGFGFSYVEASSYGCPSILADIPVLREIAGDTAWYVDHEDPDKIAQALQAAPLNASLRNMGQLAGRRVAELYNAPRFKQQLLEALT